MGQRIGKYKVSNRESDISLVDGGTINGNIRANQNAEFKKITATTGVLNQNSSVDSSTGVIDLTSIVADHRLILTGTHANQIKLPQATAANAGMLIEVLFAADGAGTGAQKIGVEQGESTVIKGVVSVNSTTADNSMTIPIHGTTSNTQNVVFHAGAQDHSGGNEGTIARFYYAGADLIFADVRGITAGNNPALADGTTVSATGWS